MRPHIWPGLALAGGVVIAAVVALVLLGSGGGDGNRSLPHAADPGNTRLFPPSDQLAAKPPARPARKRRSSPPASAPAIVPVGPGNDAAAVQYDAQGTRGTVLGEP